MTLYMIPPDLCVRMNFDLSHGADTAASGDALQETRLAAQLLVRRGMLPLCNEF